VVEKIENLVISLDFENLYSILDESKKSLDLKIDENDVLDLAFLLKKNILYDNMNFLEQNLDYVLSFDPTKKSFFEIFNLEEPIQKVMKNLSTHTFLQYGDSCLYVRGFDGVKNISNYDVSQLGSMSYKKSVNLFENISEDRVFRRFLHENGFNIDDMTEQLKKKYDKFNDYLDLISDASSKIKNPAIEIKNDVSKKNIVILPKEKEKQSIIFEEPEDKKKYLTDLEYEIYLNIIDFEKIRNDMKKIVIGQEKAIDDVIDNFILSATGTADPKTPRNTLAVGPTGVGKNYLFEVLSEKITEAINIKTGYKEIPCSKYVFEGSINDLIGSSKGYIGSDEPAALTMFYLENIRENPFNILLFDEFEKGHPKLIEFFLPVLDKGGIVDNEDKFLDLSKTYIAFTSNLGYSDIRGNKKISVGFSSDVETSEKKARKDKIEDVIMNYFSPEFINRVNIVHFDYLTKEGISSIFELEKNKIFERYENNYDLDLEITDSAKNYIINKGYSMEYGARFLRNTLEKLVNKPLSNKVFLDQDVDLDSAKKYLDFLKEEKSKKEINVKHLKDYINHAIQKRLPYKKLIIDFKNEQIQFRN